MKNNSKVVCILRKWMQFQCVIEQTVVELLMCAGIPEIAPKLPASAMCDTWHAESFQKIRHL